MVSAGDDMSAGHVAFPHTALTTGRHYARSSWLTPTVGDAVDATLDAVAAPVSAVPMARDATPARAATPHDATRDAAGALAMVAAAALAMSRPMPPRAAGRVVRARGAGATRTCPSLHRAPFL